MPQGARLPAARLIQHTQDLMASEEKLCVKVLRTLQQMLRKKAKYGDRVSARRPTAGCGGRTVEPVVQRHEVQCGALLLPPGQPATQDAAAKLPASPQVQLSGGPSRPHGHRSVLPPPPCLWVACLPSPGRSHPLAPPQVSLPILGLDQDWSAIASTQCRLDKEGATKLVCDLITSTKNEKIFQESIGLAIRLLDGGNTEIQVWGRQAWAAGGSPPFGSASHSGGGRVPSGLFTGSRLLGRVSVGSSTAHTCPLCHMVTFLCCSQPCLPTVLPSIMSTLLASQPLPRPPPHLSHILLSLWCPARGPPPPKSPLGLLYPQSFFHSFSESASSASVCLEVFEAPSIQ